MSNCYYFIHETKLALLVRYNSLNIKHMHVTLKKQKPFILVHLLLNTLTNNYIT